MSLSTLSFLLGFAPTRGPRNEVARLPLAVSCASPTTRTAVELTTNGILAASERGRVQLRIGHMCGEPCHGICKGVLRATCDHMHTPRMIARNGTSSLARQMDLQYGPLEMLYRWWWWIERRGSRLPLSLHLHDPAGALSFPRLSSVAGGEGLEHTIATLQISYSFSSRAEKVSSYVTLQPQQLGSVRDLVLRGDASCHVMTSIASQCMSSLASVSLENLSSLGILGTHVCGRETTLGASPQPSLTSLTVDFSYTLSSIAPLSRLPTLRVLALRRTDVADLSALSGLRELEHLDLTFSLNVIDVSPLAELGRLRCLLLRETGITSFDCFAARHFPIRASLVTLIADGCRSLASIEGLKGLSALRYVNLERTPVAPTACTLAQTCPSLLPDDIFPRVDDR